LVLLQCSLLALFPMLELQAQKVPAVDRNTSTREVPTVARKSVRRSVQHTRRRTSQCNVRRTMKRSLREGGNCPGVREREVQIDRCARYRGVYVFMGESDARVCSRRPEVQFAGTVRDRQGTKQKVEAWESLGGQFATCSSANDLECWFAWKRLIRPFRGGVDDD
jgi:hypothetical protein